MLGWALAFFVTALIAAAFGFMGAAAVAGQVAKLLFVVFLVLSVLSLVVHIIGSRRAP